MYAIITGASSGIGREIAFLLAKKNYDLILVARREERLINLAREIKDTYHRESLIFPLDISKLENIDVLFEKTKELNIEILINNAGMGEANFFFDSLKDQEIIDLNIKAMQYIFKKYYQMFSNQKNGYILNVASMAAYMPGPKMSCYYASKAYVLSLSKAVSYESKKLKNNVHISAICPGPVDTEFNDVAHVNFGAKSISAKYCAKVAVKGLFKKKRVIIPSLMYNILGFLSHFAPTSLLLAISYHVQNKKKR